MNMKTITIAIMAFLFLSAVTTINAQSISTTNSSPQFSIGEVVITTANVNVRTGPSILARSLAISSFGTQGTVIGGPTSADGYIWW